MEDAPVPEMPEPGLYRHYKGGLYTLIAVGRHSETEEWLAIYRSEAPRDEAARDGTARDGTAGGEAAGEQGGGGIWVRPLAMWSESVGGVPRFAPYSPARRSPN
jgi:hypothetical protein